MNSSHHPSLFKRLLVSLLVPVTLFILIAAALAVLVAGRSVNSLYDRQMQGSAEILLAFLHYELDEHSGEEDDDHHDDDDDLEDDDLLDELTEIVSEIELQQNLQVNYRLEVNNSTLFTSSLVRSFENCSPGYSYFQSTIIPDRPNTQTNSQTHNQTSTQTSTRWRCYRKTQKLALSGDTLDVEIFDSVTRRNSAIKSLLLAAFSPIILLPLVVTLATLWALRRGIAPIHQMSAAVTRRSADNLKPLIRADKPTELLPIVDSVNGLLSSVRGSIRREKQFTDDAAHELRTPVTSIKMLEQLIRRDNSDPTLEGHLDNLKLAADHSHNLLEQLLKFARLQSSKSIDKENLVIAELIQAQLGILSTQLTTKSMAIEFKNSDNRTIIFANSPAIGLLLNNLLSNAIKFSPVGGTIFILLNNNTLRIEDDGPGIRVMERETVFKRFYRTASASTTQGSGLGLAIAKWVADSHDYQLTMEDPVVGHGTSVRLRFNQAG